MNTEGKYALMTNCTVYIDEAGDLGINRGTKWFVLTACIVDKNDEPVVRARMQEIKKRLNIREIHTRKVTDFNKRAYIVRELNDIPFTYMNVLVDTTQFDREKIPDSSIAYNYVCKYLLQRVSVYLNDTYRVADVVLSARGTSKDGELIEYIQDKLLPYRGNRIDQERFGKVTAKAAAEWDLLQLADVCATSMFLGYEVNGWGFCVPCYTQALDSHLLRHHNHLESYGIKFFQESMRPDPGELMSMRICAKKERIPGATTT